MVRTLGRGLKTAKSRYSCRKKLLKFKPQVAVLTVAFLYYLWFTELVYKLSEV